MFNLGELLSLGYLQDGDVIYWKRPRMGLTHFATIKRGGEVVTSDGTKLFLNVSSASLLVSARS